MTRDDRSDIRINDAYASDAEAIGLLAINLGEQTSVTTALDDRVGDYDPLGDLTLPSGTSANLYQYEREDETRYAAETIERTATGDVQYHSYIFADEPNAEDVSRATLIAEASLQREEDG
ncbi:MAG: hypothetical protein ABEH78_06530 [Haloferacaceae archaeon]